MRIGFVLGGLVAATLLAAPPVRSQDPDLKSLKRENDLLREGVPLKMTWRFGPNPLTKQGTAPSTKIASFASLTVDADVGGGRTAVEFRDVPAVISLPKKK